MLKAGKLLHKGTIARSRSRMASTDGKSVKIAIGQVG